MTLFQRDGERSLYSKSRASKVHDSLSPWVFLLLPGRDGAKQAKRKKKEKQNSRKQMTEKSKANRKWKWDKRAVERESNIYI